MYVGAKYTAEFQDQLIKDKINLESAYKLANIQKDKLHKTYEKKESNIEKELELASMKKIRDIQKQSKGKYYTGIAIT
jgi:hypothetical protein